MTSPPPQDREPGSGPDCHGPAAGAPSLAGPRTPGDTGEADPRLERALAGWAEARDPRTEAGVYAVLPTARLFVPVVARLVEAETSPETGLRPEKTSEMAVVTLVAPSGSTALPAFLSVASLRRWRLDARPVPVSGQESCLAAQDGGHVAVVVEPGAEAFPVQGAALASLAAGWVPAAGGAGGGLASRRVRERPRFSPPAQPADAALRAVLGRALGGEDAVAEAYLVDAAVGDEPPAPALALVLARDLVPEALAALAARVGRALASSPGRVEALDLAVLTADQRAEVRRWCEPLSEGRPGPRPDPGPGDGRADVPRRWWRRTGRTG